MSVTGGATGKSWLAYARATLLCWKNRLNLSSRRCRTPETWNSGGRPQWRKNVIMPSSRHGSSDTAAAPNGSSSEQGTDTIGLLAELYTRIDEAGRRIAEYSDRLRIAGLVCKRTSDRVRLAH